MTVPTPGPLPDTSPSPHETAARRFPLIPRAKPPCPPLDVRLAQIHTRAHALDEGDDQPLLRAAQAHNLAALTASDCGLPHLAHKLCIRQATIFLTARPLDAPRAKLALQPLINIARLRNRDGDGAAAYHVFEQLFTAAKTRTNAELDGLTVPFADLTVDTENHREIVRWLWSVLLADGTRALAHAGHWPEALKHARQHNAIGQRLLDGRQITILAHSASGRHDTALTLLTESDTPTSWEDAVAAALHTLCLSRAGQATDAPAARMVHRYLTAEASDREHAAFRVQLGLCAVDITEDTPARQQITDTLVHDALETSDAYLARDILAHQACHVRIDAKTERTLRAIVHTANLGRGTLPAELHDNLMESASFSETTLSEILQDEKNGESY